MTAAIQVPVLANALPADAAAVSALLQPDEPVFCFSATALAARAFQFTKNFPGLVTFAVKSNPSVEVIRTLAGNGITSWDVASVHEMKLVREISPTAHFHYHNPVKSRREIEDAYRIYNCKRFVVDCREELDKIIRADVAVVKGEGSKSLPKFDGMPATTFEATIEGWLLAKSIKFSLASPPGEPELHV